MRPPGLVLTYFVVTSTLVRTQSTCAFMKQTPYDLSDMPEEPRIAANLTQCNVAGRHTCCTPLIESEMERFARQRVDQFVQSHVITMRQTLDEFAREFRHYFRDALRSAERQLDQMFTATYGPFYQQHTKLFSDFFDEVDEQFAVDEPAASLRPALGSLFRRVFVVVFGLMNPMRSVEDAERHCMARLQTTLRPFGQTPVKLSLQLERAFRAWKRSIDALESVSRLLISMADKIQLRAGCTNGLVRLRQCHVCVGANPLIKPCMGFCLNVLKGCFAEIAEVDPQWTKLIETLQLLSTRLKSASNPYAVFAPFPVQLSEAIMVFQERGDAISNRILFQCFEPKLRSKRSLPSEILMEQDRPIVVTDGQHGSSQWLKDSLDEQYKKANDVKERVNKFVDWLVRMKSVWRLLPSTLCSDGQLAASPGDQCWNGEDVAAYRRPVVGAGVKQQARNVEFQDLPLNLSKETFIDERLKLASMTVSLESVYEGRARATVEVEGSALEELGSADPDDEDAIEGSAYQNCDETPNNDFNFQLLEQRGPPRNSGAGFSWPLAVTVLCTSLMIGYQL